MREVPCEIKKNNKNDYMNAIKINKDKNKYKKEMATH